MNIKVNGTSQDFSEPVTIAELLKINKVDKPEMVSVQLNGEFVDRSDFADIQVSERDEVDFLYFMGGGQKKSQVSRTKYQENSLNTGVTSIGREV